MQFYLTLALLLWSAQKASALRAYFPVAFLLLIGLSVLASMKVLPTPRGFMFAYWWAFALGGLCYWTVVRRISAAYLAISCGIILCSAGGVHGDWRLTSAMTVGLIFLAWRRNAMHRWLADPVSQFFGEISRQSLLTPPALRVECAVACAPVSKSVGCTGSRTGNQHRVRLADLSLGRASRHRAEPPSERKPPDPFAKPQANLI